MNNINPETFTEKSLEALNAAASIAKQRSNTEVLQVHLLSALIAQDSGIVGSILNKLGPDKRSALELGIGRVLDTLPKVNGSTAADPYISTGLSSTLSRAESIAKEMRDDFISTEHLFIAIVENPEPVEIADLFRSLHHLLQLAGKDEQHDGCRSAHKDEKHEEVEKIFYLISKETFCHAVLRIISAQCPRKLVCG